ncbi:enoyl-CoA hydratase/isomerase family protein [Neptuniibacter halophilus]|uniref:enoyl-CoA hydratase/isomerase family protein n=1 Tax=Neptuniibacter halophilus TaxID=651666 RepID=UPI0025740EC3|nr:enoyl-CoA hydratase-related protein [Neptuniibacter halophilus]
MSISHYETLIYRKHPAYAEIRLNRPERLNAVIEALYLELLQALQQAESDPEVRAVLLSGEGRAFCVGADMKAHGEGQRTLPQRHQYLQLANEVCARIIGLKKPVLAAVQGYALGAGAEMACSCDFVLMAESARIGFPEVSIGTCVGGGVSQLLPRMVGLRKAQELLFMGAKIDAAEAQRIGLISRAVADEVLESEARHVVEQLAALAPVSMAQVKSLLNQAAHQPMQAQMLQERDAIFFCSTTADWQEGVDAFAAKRPPQFRGE